MSDVEPTDDILYTQILSENIIMHVTEEYNYISYVEDGTYGSNDKVDSYIYSSYSMLDN